MCKHNYKLISFVENEDGEIEYRKFECTLCGLIKEEWYDGDEIVDSNERKV